MQCKLSKSRDMLLGVSLVLAGAALALSAHAQNRTHVSISGYELTPRELTVHEQQLGARITPGDYLYDARSGCWMELRSGLSRCPGNAGSDSGASGNSDGGTHVSRSGVNEPNSGESRSN